MNVLRRESKVTFDHFVNYSDCTDKSVREVGVNSDYYVDNTNGVDTTHDSERYVVPGA